ncbi:rhomboid family intramembrane serine protease [Chitinophaga alhagiae]|uniref:rhomboid family intramembrane serine protease n=1 Tax=Chitinophaga alhagiae TaxID=2203219 RepID=UPI000E5BA6E0|nr:rhomboid family intramembrane serine protease [Chitinophaga alhagiae]
MKAKYAYTRELQASGTSFQFSFALKDQLNLLIIAHLLLYAAYLALGWAGTLDAPLGEGKVDDLFRHFLPLSAHADDVVSNWSASLVTYQFIHSNFAELLISMTMLWFFGHILKSRVGAVKVVMLYFIFAVISALTFNIAHIIFPIFAGPGEIMDGAFGGVLGVMTVATSLYGKTRFRLSNRIQPTLWQIYAGVVLLSLFLVCKNNISDVMVYAVTIYLGARWASVLKRSQPGNSSAMAEVHDRSGA